MTSLSVLITGAASGIGAATAQLAAERGHRVVLADVDLAGAEALAGRLGPPALAVALDVREGAQWDAALQAAVAAFGRLDVLVNNAGIIHTGYARDLTMAQHRDMVEVNYLGVVGGVMAALPLMREQGHGHIVDVCSMTSFMPLTGYATYGGTKHAMRAFHHSVAIEERRGPVAFTIIHPPSVRTPMLGSGQRIGLSQRRTDDLHARFVCQVRKRIRYRGVTGHLPETLEESLHPWRAGYEQHQQAPGTVAHVLPCVRHALGDERERAGRRVADGAGDLHPERTIEEVEDLVVVHVHMQRWTFPGAHRALEGGQLPAGASRACPDLDASAERVRDRLPIAWCGEECAHRFQPATLTRRRVASTRPCGCQDPGCRRGDGRSSIHRSRGGRYESRGRSPARQGGRRSSR